MRSDKLTRRSFLASSALAAFATRVAAAPPAEAVTPALIEAAKKEAVLRAVGVDPSEPEPVAAEGPLAGKTFVITGTLSAPREEIARRIESAGGTVAGSVSKKTHYLVAGAKTGAAKLAAAEKHGVTVVDEIGLAALLASGSPE